MVRSLWIRALAATLVWTGVAWAQQPTSPRDDKKSDQILTIQETGKSPQKCKVINSWRMKDGHQAYQVRGARLPGEMITITEKGNVRHNVQRPKSTKHRDPDLPLGARCLQVESPWRACQCRPVRR